MRIQRRLKTAGPAKPEETGLGGCVWHGDIGVCYRLLEKTGDSEKVDTGAVYLVHRLEDLKVVLMGVEATTPPGYVRLWIYGESRAVRVHAKTLLGFLNEAVRICLDAAEMEARIGLAKALRRVMRQ